MLGRMARDLPDDHRGRRRPQPSFARTLGLALALLWSVGAFAPRSRGDDLGLKVPPGFQVTLYADETLADDTYAMTLDARGRVVVTTRGEVKILHDSRGVGRADRATRFVATATGGMGLCFDGDDLYFCGDGWFSRYRDTDGDGRADGPPEHLVPLAFAEHGGHAMRKGPDGGWYLIGGNDSGIGRAHASTPSSPVRDPEAGALLRLTPDGRHPEVIAHGFRNPYDFDFNAAGDLFTYDSDVERDAFLPWYVPTRIYHVGYAGHHGWRLTGFQRSWPRRNDFLDTVDILWPVGRGSPTGVACYRHDQFPEHYRGGLFALDWTFGKVYFFPLRPEGASYRTEPEVFLEPTGTLGFAPTDAAVASDGSLLISIGGRKTRGAVYRIAYVGEGNASERPRIASTDVDAVLYAPQPLDAWSRARWVPAARALGRRAFLDAAADESRDEGGRVRAVEVATELFGGLTEASARAGAKAEAPTVRARVAWSLGRIPCPGFADILMALAEDPRPRVRLAALEALADRIEAVDADRAGAVAAQGLGHPEKRVRQAAARLAAVLPEAAWEALWSGRDAMPPQARLGLGLAAVWRHPERAIHDAVVELAVATLGTTEGPGLRLQAVRLIVRALGDYRLKDPPVEIDTGYALAPSLRGREPLVARVREAVRRLFPSGHERLDDEAARLLAMLEDDDPGLPRAVAAFWTEDSAPTRDLHFLIVFSRLGGPTGGDLTPRVARALLALDRKLQGQEQRIKQSWNDRLAEVATRLLRRDPRLADALLRDPAFVAPGHVALASCLVAEARERAARLFLAAAREDRAFPWSGPLIDLLASLPAEEVRPDWRAHWSDFGLRDALLIQLAREPDAADRDSFLWGLGSAQPQVVAAALEALGRLPRDPTAEGLVPVLRLLRRLLREPREAALRGRVVALIERQGGQSFAIRDEGTEPSALRDAYRPVFDWFARAYPGRSLDGGEEDLDAWGRRLKAVDWSRGDARRGEAVFRARSCQTCHAGGRALGPDLSGVTGRFSRDDLFTAIVAPSLDVSPLYRTTLIETRAGQVFEGLVAFESADGVILQTGSNLTVRIATPDIEARRPGDRSLMPDGLLKDLTPGDLADLYAFLKTLSPPPGTSPPRPSR